MKNMMINGFTTFLYSTEKLDEKELKISFDTDILYNVTITKQETIQKERFGYTLFCAYNNEQIKSYGEISDELSLEDYEKSI